MKNNTSKSINTNNNSINSENKELQMGQNFNGSTVRFVESTSIPGAMGTVIFTPEKWNGLVADSSSCFDATSGLNAIRDFLAGTYQKAGEFVHVFNPKSSRYDGMKTFYVGGNLAFNAIQEGHQTMTVQVADKTISLTLPATIENIGEWVTVKMRTDFWGRVVPATDPQHRSNITMKHFFLNKLLDGTKLVINTTPVVYKGEMWIHGSNNAKLLRTEMFGEDGTAAKSVEEMIKPYNDRKLEYQGDARLDKQTATMMKVAPIIGLSVLSVIKVGDVEMEVTAVPQGRYQILDSLGNVKNYCVHVNGTLESENRLKTAATNKWVLSAL